MQKKTDRRVRKTKTQLRNGLAMLMKEKSVGEITVKELVDQVDINRSTFYLHYPDISGLLYEIENDLAEEMERAIREHPIEKREDNGFYFLQDIFQVLDNNREIVSALVGPYGDIRFIKTWLADKKSCTPEFAADFIYRMVVSSMRAFCETREEV